MRPQKQISTRLADAVLRVGLASLLILSMVACQHKAARQMLPQISLVPIELETLPESDDPPMLEAASDIADESPLEVPGQVEPRPARSRRKPVQPKDPVLPPVQVASAEPAAIAIGALSTGGDTMPQRQQQAKDSIASVMKRIGALPAKAASEHKSQVNQVGRFLKQAQEALASGDADGAKNLATKAGLLMDEIEKVG